VWYQSQWAPNITFFVNANYAIAEDKLVIRSAKPDPVERDRITLLVLNREAQLETPEYFHTVTPTEPAKILWDSTGHALGYYLYSNDFGFPEGISMEGIEQNKEYPLFSTLYIRKQFRRKGYGELLWNDFIKHHSNGQIIVVESPNKIFCAFLEKVLGSKLTSRVILWNSVSERR